MQRIRFFSYPLLVFTFCISSLVYGQSGIIAKTRSTDWSTAGIPGGIPSDSWTQCGPTIAAYGSSGSYASPNTIINAIKHTGSGYASCGANTYVLLGPGDFYLNSGIRNVGVSNVELRGSGPTQTRLHFSQGSVCQGGNGSCLISFESADGTYPTGPPANIYNWTGGYTQSSNTITLSSGANIKANSTLIVLDQCDTGYSGTNCSGSAVDNGSYFNCEDAYSSSRHAGCSFNASNGGAARPHRFQWEIVEATSCSPSCGSSGTTTVTITPGLQHPNWASGQTPQAWLIQPARYIGIRNLLIDGSASAVNDNTAGPSFYNTSYYWAQNIVVENTGSIGIYMLQTAHGDVESNYIYAPGRGDPGNDPSAINYTGSNNLIVNNIMQKSHTCTFGNGPNAGNVIAYNYAVNTYTGDGFLFGCIWDGHSNGADYNLFEGNVVPQVFQDQTHGTHLMETWYRNFLTGWESCANGNCGSNTSKSNDVVAVEDLSYNRYGNFVGNVLGTPGINTNYQDLNDAGYVTNSTGYVYVVGAGNTTTPPDVAGGPIPADPVVGTTMFRWGNWDTSHGTTQWNASEVPSGISVYPNPVPTTVCTSSISCPASFYYSSRPVWWSNSTPFPAIGPDVTSGNVGQCTGAPNSPGKYALLPATSSSQCTGTSLTSAWGGHVNAIPAMSCYLSAMNGSPDGTGGILSFDATSCYSSPGTRPSAPTGLIAVPQ